MKFIDYNSPEKAIINTTFKSIPYMDMWISSIVEGYIYGKAEDPSPSAPNPKGVIIILHNRRNIYYIF
jgi:hypothetical protein